MPKLHVFSLGGDAPGANIEVHDIQFVACDTLEEAFPALVERWYGVKSTLHLDGYAVLTWADGYDVTLSSETAVGPLHLFFVNLGGYIAGDLAEAHRFAFFVAETAEEAKRKAKAKLLTTVDHQHKDNEALVDNVLLLAEVKGLHIHLTPNPDGADLVPAWQGYRPIGA